LDQIGSLQKLKSILDALDGLEGKT
jgi:hypothetical protein